MQGRLLLQELSESWCRKPDAICAVKPLWDCCRALFSGFSYIPGMLNPTKQLLCMGTWGFQHYLSWWSQLLLHGPSAFILGTGEWASLLRAPVWHLLAHLSFPVRASLLQGARPSHFLGISLLQEPSCCPALPPGLQHRNFQRFLPREGMSNSTQVVHWKQQDVNAITCKSQIRMRIYNSPWRRRSQKKEFSVKCSNNRTLYLWMGSNFCLYFWKIW